MGVSLEGNERKKHVVHRHRLRSIKILQKPQAEEESSGEANSHVESESKEESQTQLNRKDETENVASEPSKKPRTISKTVDKTPVKKNEVARRPKRDAAIKARDRLRKMK